MQVELSGEEWEKLRELSSGPIRLPLTEAVARRLCDAGYAQHTNGGYVATPLGQAAVERHFSRQG